MSTFTTAAATNIGTSPVTVYTATETCVLIGLNITNVSTGIVPVDVLLNNGVNDVYVRKNLRIDGGSNEEIMSGNKIVLTTGNTISVRSGVDSSVDVILSLLSGV